MATEYLWLIDPLNAWGSVLIGTALILGAAVRFSAFWGATMMLFYWASSLLLEHAVVVQHVVYVTVLFGLGTLGAGRVAGLDAFLERTHAVRERPALRYLLG